MIPLFKVRMAKEAPERVREVLESGYIGQGPMVEKFETLLEAKFGRRPLTTSSCTHALDLAYYLVGVQRYSIVISTPMTCLATNLPLYHRGARIVWADTEPYTGNIDPDDVERIIKLHKQRHEHITAIVCVAWTGRDVRERLEEVSTKYNIPVIEDAAHVFHRKEWGQPEDWYTAYSFQAIKHLTTGDGGALIVPKGEYDRAKRLRWFGLDRTKGGMRGGDAVPEAGFKYHMNDIAAAIGIANFNEACDSVARARDNAKYYQTQLKRAHVIQAPPPDETSSWWMYVIQTPRRKQFIKFMAKRGIMVGTAHRDNRLSYLWPPNIDYGTPNVTEYDAEQCSIPVGWWLNWDTREAIVAALMEWDSQLPMRSPKRREVG